MGQVIAILMSYDNIYRDDNSDDNFMDINYESSSTNSDEFTIPNSPTTTDWIYYNNKKMYRDYGIQILN